MVSHKHFFLGGLVAAAMGGAIFLCPRIVASEEPPAETEAERPAPAPVAPAAPVAPEESIDFKDPFMSALPSKEKDLPEDTPVEEGAVEAEPEEEFDPAKYQVTGLVWGQAAPKAIINDSIYGIGDTVEGAKIINIDKEGILWEFNSKEYLMKRDSGSVSEQGGE